jgi:hypothetical protein
VRPDDLGVTEVELALGGARSLTAPARAVEPPQNETPTAHPIVMTWWNGDGSTTSRTFELGAPEIVLRIDGLDGTTLRARVARPGGDPRGAWLLLEDVRYAR